jgi:hypothetical protein
MAVGGWLGLGEVGRMSHESVKEEEEPALCELHAAAGLPLSVLVVAFCFA